MQLLCDAASSRDLDQSSEPKQKLPLNPYSLESPLSFNWGIYPTCFEVYGWLSKLWSPFGYPKYMVPYYKRDPKREHNFDNHPYPPIEGYWAFLGSQSFSRRQPSVTSFIMEPPIHGYHHHLAACNRRHVTYMLWT